VVHQIGLREGKKSITQEVLLLGLKWGGRKYSSLREGEGKKVHGTCYVISREGGCLFIGGSSEKKKRHVSSLLLLRRKGKGVRGEHVLKTMREHTLLRRG